MKNFRISKKTILYFLVFFWLVFSISYIFWDVWNDFNMRQLSNAYQQGATDIINRLIIESEKCQLIPIFSGEKQVQLINVNCLNILTG